MARMSFLQHILELKAVLLGIIGVISFWFLFFFTIGVQPLDLPPYFYPWPTVTEPMSVLVNRVVIDWLLPDIVDTATYTAAEGMMVSMKMALFLGLMVSMPVVVHQLLGYFAPALKQNERRFIAWVSVPSALLFMVGALFCLFFILPFTFDLLHGINVATVDYSYQGLDNFFTIVLYMTLAFGLSFQLPVVMVGLTRLGIVEHGSWLAGWRYATVAFFAFGALVTPDGSGITMILVAVPMIALYFGGWFVAMLVDPDRKERAARKRRIKA